MWREFGAEILVVTHFAWVAFMIAGFVVQLLALRIRSLREWSLTRLAHVLGIGFVAILIVIDRPCPLTVWESQLRSGQNPAQAAGESFLVRWLERLLYPDVDPLVVYVPTVIMAIMSLCSFLVFPPARFRRFLRFR